MSKPKKVATKTIRIPNDLHRRVKAHVKSNGISIEFWAAKKLEAAMEQDIVAATAEP